MKASQLRASLLQMAVSGRLVPQFAEEGTAADLLKEIEAEKKALISTGKLKKEKPLPEITEDEIPFEIPESWVWVRLGKICTEFLVPQRDKPTVFSGDIPWCRIEDITGKYLNGTKSNQYVSLDTVNKMNLRINPVGTVLCSCSASLGVAAIVKAPCCVNQTFIGLVLSSHMFNEYIYYMLIQYGKSFQKMGTGTTIPYISKEKFKKMLIPLPPLAEQRRIVAKLEELLPLVDAYEKEEQQLTALETAFPENMRKSILQEAVSGKLVPQIAEEGTAAELLKEIEAEKKAFISTGKLKKEKPLPEITEDEIPFEIPESWKWVRLGGIINLISGRDLESSEYTDKKCGVPYLIGASNIDNGEILVERWTEKPQVLSHVGDLLLTCKGTVGKTLIQNVGDVHIARQIMALRPYSKLYCPYLKIVIDCFKDILTTSARSMIPGISRDHVLLLSFPLPPLAEQRRIAAKVEELMRLVDTL